MQGRMMKFSSFKAVQCLLDIFRFSPEGIRDFRRVERQQSGEAYLHGTRILETCLSEKKGLVPGISQFQLLSHVKIRYMQEVSWNFFLNFKRFNFNAAEPFGHIVIIKTEIILSYQKPCS